MRRPDGSAPPAGSRKALMSRRHLQLRRQGAACPRCRHRGPGRRSPRRARGRSRMTRQRGDLGAGRNDLVQQGAVVVAREGPGVSPRRADHRGDRGRASASARAAGSRPRPGLLVPENGSHAEETPSISIGPAADRAACPGSACARRSPRMSAMRRSQARLDLCIEMPWPSTRSWSRGAAMCPAGEQPVSRRQALLFERLVDLVAGGLGRSRLVFG